MERLPKPLREVVEEFAALPGIGPKSALRIGLTLLKRPKESVQSMGGKIARLRENLCLCNRCQGLSETEVCAICSDPDRDSSLLCLVSEWDSLLSLEEMGQFKGLYLVLGGLLSPMDSGPAQGLDTARLRERLAEGTVGEIVLALGTTLDAESTASYIKNMVDRDFPGVRLTRLAQGIPLGSEVKFVDRETLRQSLRYRQDV